MEALTCSHCCAPLPPPNGNTAVCRFCGMAHFLAPPARTAPEEDFDEDEEDDDELDEETIVMSHAAIVELLRERFVGEDAFYIAPSVPPKKERNARAMHAGHLPAHEAILGLYDGTVFGAADDGFVITARRLCWRNMTERPQMLEWHQIDPDTISIDENRICIRGARIDTIADTDGDFLDTCEEVLPILARSARKAAAAPQPAAQGHGGYGPPHSQQGHGGYGPPPPAQGHGGYGPPQAQHGYGGYGPPQPAQHGYGGYGPPQPQHGHGGYGPPHSQQGHGGYGPPAQQPVFGCWHCRSPLHWQSMRCPRCGAAPGPQGWPRLA